MAAVKLSVSKALWEAVFTKQINVSTDTFRAVLHTTNTDLDTDDSYADIVGELSTGGGYTAAGFTVTVTISMASGLPVVSIEGSLTASGSVGPFQYLSVYDDTSTGNTLVGTIDYGSSFTMAASDVLDIPEHAFLTVAAMF